MAANGRPTRAAALVCRLVHRLPHLSSLQPTLMPQVPCTCQTSLSHRLGDATFALCRRASQTPSRYELACRSLHVVRAHQQYTIKSILLTLFPPAP